MIPHFFSTLRLHRLAFDQAMQLLEFDSLREQIDDINRYTGEYKNHGHFTLLVERYVRSLTNVVEVPTPMMLLPGGVLLRDCCIANHYDARNPERLRGFVADVMARKILGVQYGDIAPGYYRMGWLPPPKLLPGLRPVKFHYPAAGMFGVLAQHMGTLPPPEPRPLSTGYETVQVAYVHGSPVITASVLFVVDKSPVFRVTNQDCCIGLAGQKSRLVVEYRGECDVEEELASLGVCHDARVLGHGSFQIPVPTRAAVERNPRMGCNTFADYVLRSLKGAK